MYLCMMDDLCYCAHYINTHRQGNFSFFSIYLCIDVCQKRARQGFSISIYKRHVIIPVLLLRTLYDVTYCQFGFSGAPLSLSFDGMRINIPYYTSSSIICGVPKWKGQKRNKRSPPPPPILFLGWESCDAGVNMVIIKNYTLFLVLYYYLFIIYLPIEWEKSKKCV